MSRPLRNILALALLTTTGLSACHHAATATADDAVAVRVTQVSEQRYEEAHRYSGTLEEASSVALAFNAGGRVTAVHVREGQRVQAGALLATLDNTTALSAHQAAQAALEQAEDAMERVRQVYEKGGLPEARWVEVKTRVAQARSMADVAQRNLDDCQLRAPVGGTVADRSVEVGSSVAPLQPVMRLLNLGSLYVRIGVPEGDVAEVRVGDHATVEVSSLGGQALPAVVEERAVNADPLTHSYMARLRLTQRRDGLLPGMVCQVTLGGVSPTSGVSVPARAVQLSSEGQRFVWVVEADSTVSRRAVTIGDMGERGVFVSSGLRGGDRVVTDGMLKLSSGTRVTF